METAASLAGPHGSSPVDALLRGSARHGTALAVAVAALAALPALRLPFLADDWITLAAVVEGGLLRTPYGYFRPLYLATWRLDWTAWGLSPMAFHLTNLLLICGATAAVVHLIRRYTGDAALSALAGFFFAIQPWHFHNAGWISARPDALCALLYAFALIRYDVWRRSGSGAPIAALVLLAAALLSKEAAASLPAVVMLVGLCDPSRRPARREIVAGYLPLWGVTIVHFLWVRPAALGGWGLSVLQGFGAAWLWKLAGFSAGAVIPATIDALEAHPVLWGALAAGAAASLLAAARAGGGLPPVALAAGAVYVLTLAPSLISFQERYYFLPSAAAATVLAALLLACRRRLSGLFGLALALVCVAMLVLQWNAWADAGSVSGKLMTALSRAARRPDTRDIVIVNLPYRVAGVPIVADFQSALRLMDSRDVPVLVAASIDYPSAGTPALDGPWAGAVISGPDSVEVRLRIDAGLFSRYDGPRPATAPSSPAGELPAGGRVELGYAAIQFEGPHRLDVRVPRPAGAARAVLVWTGQRVEQP